MTNQQDWTLNTQLLCLTAYRSGQSFAAMITVRNSEEDDVIWHDRGFATIELAQKAARATAISILKRDLDKLK